jgi:putative membrane protein
LNGRHWAFYAGLAAVFAALLTPLDAISEHVFAVHQIQHLLLRGIAPMLLMLAVPSGPLIAGLPVALRRRIVAPLMTQRAVRAIFGFLARPLVCTLLYVGTLYIWQVPAIHDLALLRSGWHYLMHDDGVVGAAVLLGGVRILPQPWPRRFTPVQDARRRDSPTFRSAR